MSDTIKAIIVFLLVFIFSSDLYVSFQSMNPAVEEKYWFYTLYGFTALFLVLSPVESLSNIPKAAFIWILLALISTFLAYSLSSRSSTTHGEMTLLFKGLSVFICMFVLLTDQKIIRAAFYALILVIIVNASINLDEFLQESARWRGISGRAAGWHYNANKSGKFLVMSLVFASIVIPRKLLWPLILVASAGIIVTFSRSSWVALFIVIVGISLIRSTPVGKNMSLLNMKPSSFISLLLGGVIASVLLFSVFSGQLYESLKDTRFEKYFSEQTMGRMNSDFTDTSATERKMILMKALETGVKNPLIGKGLSYTYEWDHFVPPHNDYAKLFAERGFTGVILYLSLLGLIWFKGGRSAKLFATVLAFSSFFTHNTLEQSGIFVFAALALLYKENQPVARQ